METENLKGTLTLNRNDFLIPLDRVLIECTNAVHVGLSSLDKLDNLPDSLSGDDNFFHFKPYGGEIPVADRKKIFTNWLLQKGFEDLIKAVTLMLIDVNKILNIQTKLKDTKTWDEFIATINTPDYEPTTKHFPELLDAVRPYLSDNLNLENEVKSINRVRRCLVHRNGLVSPVDFFKGETTLKLSWTYLKFVYLKDGQEVEFKPPVTILEGGGEIQTRQEKKTKEYKTNEKIEFDFLHFNELIWTVRLFGQEIIEKLTLEKR